ncbi:MAG: hypothetical protein OSJ66_04050 [Clostridia bacterium]|nr:hypothetical protein [Clostridia bacterium]
MTNGVYELYAAGLNNQYELGIGNNISQNSFSKCSGLEHPERLVTIQKGTNNNQITLFTCKDSNDNYEIYLTGTDLFYVTNSTYGKIYENITRMFDGNIGPDIDQDIQKTKFFGYTIMVLDKNNNLKLYGKGNNYIKQVKPNNDYIYEFNEENFGISGSESLNIKNIYGGQDYRNTIIERVNDNNKTEFWLFCIDGNNIGIEELKSETLNNITEYLPNEFMSTGIKQIRIVSSNIFFIDNKNKVWATGNYATLGLGENIHTNPEGLVCLQDLTKNLKYSLGDINQLYGSNFDEYNMLVIPIFEGNNGKIYITGSNIIMFRNNIVQSNWKMIANNVKKFWAKSSNEDSIGYIDFNNDLWLLGNNSYTLGMNKEEGNVPNFIRIKDNLSGENFDILNNNIKDVKMNSYATFIETLDKKLYVSGMTNIAGWPYHLYIGLSSAEFVKGSNVFIKILDNVEYWEVGKYKQYAVIKENDIYKFYVWGLNDGGLGTGGKNYEMPTEITNLPFEISKIQKIIPAQRNGYIITNDGKLYTTGLNMVDGKGLTGCGSSSSSWIVFDDALIGNEKVKDIVSSTISNNSGVILTETGNLYAFGVKSAIGVGTSSLEYYTTPVKINTMSNISSIVGGKEWYVAVDIEGKVYGTGSNTYGILGRWIGIDRKQPNSRYKTAFEWVECPELEI